MSVYFAQAGGYTKIGFSDDPIDRQSTITTSGKRPDDLPYGADVDLIGWVPGDRWTEGAHHARFISKRVAGEWFRLDKDDVAAIKALIWADPRGVDIKGMSFAAVIACRRYPELTRDELAARGVRIKAVSEEEALATIFAPTAPEAEAVPVVSPCAPVERPDASASGLLAELARVSAHRCNLQNRLEDVFAERWSR